MDVLDNLPQQITVWRYKGNDGYGGSLFEAPIVIFGRWEDKQTLLADARGQQHICGSVIYVSQTLKIGDYVGLGDQTTIVSPLDGIDSKAIQGFEQVPSLDGTEFMRKAIA